MVSASVQFDTSSFRNVLSHYINSAEVNDALHARFTEKTWANSTLARHRRYVERHQLGFGDAAFHELWRLLVAHIAADRREPSLLEIGVYKGQVISLWSLLLKEAGVAGNIYAITPLRGSPKFKSRLMTSILSRISPRYRERLKNGDFYEKSDYFRDIQGLFEAFELNFEEVCLVRGLSGDPTVRQAVSNIKFDMIYVDGDHTFDGAKSDFIYYSGLVRPGGFLVADDAGCALPGSTFWKGHQAVSQAVTVLEDLGLENVLNVGHIRVFRRPA